jgi:hypothetical protein
MTTNRFSKAAKIRQTLVFYDGPQLVLLETDRGHSMLAIAISKDGMGYPMFAAEIIGNQLEKYLQGKVDLNFVFRSTPISRLYFLDLSGTENEEVKLNRASKIDSQNKDYYPLPGVFSRSHTHPLEEEVHKGDGSQRFLIDGKWEASDFSGFYGKIADTYAMTYVSTNLATTVATETDRTFLRESITDKNWQGGGSYGAFYGGMRGRARSLHPLKVEGIEYHSPGYIDVVGNKHVLDGVIRSINRLIIDLGDIAKLYRAIYRVLRREKLLRAEKTATLSSDALETYIHTQTMKLADSVGLPNPSAVYAACENSHVIFAKVVLSYSRRIRDLARFYVEGRVKTG